MTLNPPHLLKGKLTCLVSDAVKAWTQPAELHVIVKGAGSTVRHLKTVSEVSHGSDHSAGLGLPFISAYVTVE